MINNVDFSKALLINKCIKTVIRSASKTHYEVLGIKKDSTTKEIKEAYVKLCKEFHPDTKPNNIDQHKKFIHLNEAYAVLVRPETRSIYDMKLSSQNNRQGSINSFYTDKNMNYQKPFGTREEEYYYNHRNYDENSYYGIKGVKRLNNAVIVFSCLILIISGSLFHYTAIKLGTTFSEKRLDERDKILSKHYQNVRLNAIHSKNEEQMKQFQQKLKFNTDISKNMKDEHEEDN